LQAAWQKVVKYSTESSTGTFAIIDGINDASISESGEVLDDTVFESTHSGYTSRALGLNDISMSLSGDYSTSAGQLAVRYAKRNRTDIWFQYLPNGTNGIQFKGVVATADMSGAIRDKEQISFDIQGDGSVSDV